MQEIRDNNDYGPPAAQLWLRTCVFHHHFRLSLPRLGSPKVSPRLIFAFDISVLIYIYESTIPNFEHLQLWTGKVNQLTLLLIPGSEPFENYTNMLRTAVAIISHQHPPIIPSVILKWAKNFGQLEHLSAQGQEGAQNVAKIKESMTDPLPKLLDLHKTDNLSV